jgi:ureidoglycolate hydrolase
MATKKITLNELRTLVKQIIKEGNLYHNEIYSIEQEGRFWIVSYRSFNEGTKEKVFTSEEEARAFAKTLD